MSSQSITIPLDSIAACFEGVSPATICSCDSDGVPNLTYLSIVHRVGTEHVGLSYQFFNKTRKNILENPQVQVIVVSPETGYQYRLDLLYLRTDTAGAAFDRMKTRLDAVASQTGMTNVFNLRGVDIYKVLDCRPTSSSAGTESAPKIAFLPELEQFTERLTACASLDSLFDTALDSLASLFSYDHSFVMVPDEGKARLCTLASHGYPLSGAGSEVRMGEGILGVAAKRRAVVRSTNMIMDTVYSRAVRSAMEESGDEGMLEKEIALPGLADVQSQLVAPLVAYNELLGVLCLQSGTPGRFLVDDEKAVQIIARHLAASMAMLRHRETAEQQAIFIPRPATPSAITSIVKHYIADDSIFIDDIYLIKGVAGRIFWKLLQDYSRSGRVEFSNREIRLDSTLQLPDIKDNLETRLILLRNRLKDRSDVMSLIPAGRGRLFLEVCRKLKLEELP
jgi:adenylate cyclase